MEKNHKSERESRMSKHKLILTQKNCITKWHTSLGLVKRVFQQIFFKEKKEKIIISLYTRKPQSLDNERYLKGTDYLTFLYFNLVALRMASVCNFRQNGNTKAT